MANYTPAGNGNGWDKIDGQWVPVGGGAGTGTGTGAGGSSPFNPLVQGQQVDDYMRRALANDPRMTGINQNLSGRIAPDVLRQIQQSGAERGVGIGSYGGGNDTSSMLRALGLTSMDLTNKGIGQYGDAYNSIPKVNVGDLFESEGARQAREAQQRLQTERLQQETQNQQANRDLSLNAFNVNRGDTLSNNARINAGMDAMIARLGGGGGGSGSGGGGGNAWGGTNYTPAGDGTSASAWSYAPKSDINNVTSNWVDPGYYGPDVAPDYFDVQGGYDNTTPAIDYGNAEDW
jgi:hypothetical protein